MNERVEQTGAESAGSLSKDVKFTPFDKFVDMETLQRQRQQAIRKSLRSIGIEELKKLAWQHEDEFVDDPWRQKFLQLIAQQPHASFYHAVPQEDIEVLYCRDAEFGIWILPGQAIGVLDAIGKQLMNEAIVTRSGAQNTGERKMKMLNTILVLAIMTLGACKKKEELSPVVRPVRSIVVEKRQVGDPAVGTGHLRARDEVNLAFRIGGRIIQRKLGVGDRVEAGQLVAVLDSEVERNTRNSAQADVAAAQATLDQSVAFERRQKKLLDERVISPNEYDSALRQLKTAQAQLDAAQARLKSAEEQLSYTALKSDAAGVITEKGAEVGEVVPAGKMILKVAQQSGRDAVFDVPAQAMRDGLALGEQVEIWLADNAAIKAAGKVREISPEADPVTRNYQVKVGLSDPPSGMFLGATLVGRVILRADSLIEIPSSALTMIEDKPAVWVVDAKDQRVQRRKIDVARYAPESVIVTDGLQSGERVVTAGVQQLHENQVVKLLAAQ